MGHPFGGGVRHRCHILEIPQDRAIFLAQTLHEADEVFFALHAVDCSGYLADRHVPEPSARLVGRAERVIPSTFGKNLLDLFVVKDNSERDCLELSNLEITPSRRHMDMTAAS